MDAVEYLGLDIGDRRIGVARGSSVARIAEPVTTLSAKNCLPQLKKLIEANRVSVVVVGLPRSLNGDETEQTAKVRSWVDRAKKDLASQFFFQDEALTSHAAIEKFGATKADVDAVAAAVILQDFLDAGEAERQRA